MSTAAEDITTQPIAIVGSGFRRRSIGEAVIFDEQVFTVLEIRASGYIIESIDRTRTQIFVTDDDIISAP